VHVPFGGTGGKQGAAPDGRAAPGDQPLPGAEALDERSLALARQDPNLPPAENLAGILYVCTTMPRRSPASTISASTTLPIGSSEAFLSTSRVAAIVEVRGSTSGAIATRRTARPSISTGSGEEARRRMRPAGLLLRRRASSGRSATSTHSGRGLTSRASAAPAETDCPGETVTSATRPLQGAGTSSDSAADASPATTATLRLAATSRASRPRSVARARSTSAGLVASSRMSSVSRSTRLRAASASASREDASAVSSGTLRPVARGSSRKTAFPAATSRPL
jgi:hypothetical protein